MEKKWKAPNCKNEEERIRLERMAELAADIRVNDSEVTLDFSNPKHREFYMLQFGGEEYYKNEFPKHYAMFEKSMEKACKNSAVNDTLKTVNNGKEAELHDAAQIIYAYINDAKEGCLYTKTALKNDAETILERIELYNQETGEVIWSDTNAAYNTNCSKNKIKIKEVFDGQSGSSIMCDYISTWVDKNTHTLKSSIYSHTLNLAYTGCVEKVNITNPIHKKTPANSEIVICYNRHSTSGEGVDYDNYQESFDPATGKQKLFLDVSGDVILKDEHRPYKWMDITDFVLKLYCDSGFAEYNLEGRQQEVEKCFKCTDTGFSFALDKDWKGVVPAARLPIVEDVNFLMHFSFVTATTKGSVLISSDLEPEEVSEERILISKLHLLWGCVEENTNVFMADGTQKCIKDILIGDRVMVRDGSIGVVKEIMRGDEDKLLHMDTADGQTLVCTKEHPVLTVSGMKPTHLLKGDDILICQGNKETRLSALYEVPGGRVCSLWLEAEDEQERAILTNGLYTGDFAAQNEIMKKAEREKKRRRSLKLDPETIKLIQYFKG